MSAGVSRKIGFVCGLIALFLLFAGEVQARHYSISLKTRLGNFVTAENNGGGLVSANRTQAHEWEIFTLLDLNEGELEDGDPVALKTSKGYFFSAVNGGGDKLLADKLALHDWETFFVERKTNRAGTSEIEDGDRVALRTGTNNYVSALNGGGNQVNAKPKTAGYDELFILGRRGDPVAGTLSGPFTAPQMVLRNVVGIDESNNADGDFFTCSNEYFGKGFPNCYAGHEGTDFLLAGHILAQTAGSIDVYAVAGGKVVAVSDGNTDKCFFRVPASADAPSGDFIFCVNGVSDGREFLSGVKEANFITVLQDDGIVAYYFHLKRDSIIVRVGERIECGRRLGKVGSSGVSSAPHFHLTLLRIKPETDFPRLAVDFGNIGIDRALADFINPYKPMLWRELLGVVPRKTCQADAPTCGLGQPCPSTICQVGLLMRDGVCKKIGVLFNKPCDGNQICVPGLVCSGGACRLPPPKRPGLKLP